MVYKQREESDPERVSGRYSRNSKQVNVFRIWSSRVISHRR